MADDKTSTSLRRAPDSPALRRGTVPAPHTLIGSDAVALRVFLRHGGWQQLHALFDVVPAPSPPVQHDNPGHVGALLGDVYEDDNGPFIVVEQIVPLRDTPSSDGARLFTEQTWAALRAWCAERFPTRRIVGSFHVRRDRGTTLSQYDRYVSSRFFSEWWQLTYIVDPSHNRQAMFHWQGERLQALSGFWVCADDATVTASTGAATDTLSPALPAAAAAARLEMAASTTDEKSGTVVSLFAVSLLLLAIAAVSRLPGSLPALQTQLAQSTALGEQLSAEAEALRVRHDQLQRTLSVAAANPPVQADAAVRSPTVTASARPDAPDSGSPVAALTTTDPKRTSLAAPVTLSPTGPPPSQIVASEVALPTIAPDATSPDRAPQHYVVRQGDTLWSISTRLLGNPYAYTDLAAENEIEDPDIILPGWELRWPSP